MLRNALTRKRFLWIYFLFVAVVCTQEPKCQRSYIEERMFEKIIEMDFKLQKTFEILKKIETQDRYNERATEQREDSQKHADDSKCKTQLPTCLSSVIPQSLMVTDLEPDGWQMIFSAVAGSGQNVYNAWTTGKKTCADKPVALKRSDTCNFRNSLISNWANLGINYVKCAFYDSVREVAYVIFNGTGSDMNNWFDKTRVISSSWADLTSTSIYNYFSIIGHVDSLRLDRRFYINKLYNSCPGDLGHMAVINSGVSRPACNWDNHASYPQFLYSRFNSVDFFERRMFGMADFMAIFIKT